jgi:hypothetical protein
MPRAKKTTQDSPRVRRSSGNPKGRRSGTRRSTSATRKRRSATGAATRNSKQAATSERPVDDSGLPANERRENRPGRGAREDRVDGVDADRERAGAGVIDDDDEDLPGDFRTGQDPRVND